MAAKCKMHGHRGGPCHTVAIMVVGEVKRITDDFSPPICEVKSYFKVTQSMNGGPGSSPDSVS